MYRDESQREARVARLELELDDMVDRLYDLDVDSDEYLELSLAIDEQERLVQEAIDEYY